jgi:uncharacterized protein
MRFARYRVLVSQYLSVAHTHTLLIVLTTSMACGSGATSGKPPPITEPVEMTRVPPPPAIPIDAGVVEPVPVDAPKLACPDGTTIMIAPAPEATYFCARENGVRNGPFVSEFPDGTAEVSGSYKDGKLDGDWARHYPGGAVVEHGAFDKGLKTGKWQQTGPTGTVLGEYDMKNGTGTERRWYDDGKPYMQRAMRAGAPYGDLKLWDHDGQIAITAKLYGSRYDGAKVVGAKNTMRIEESFTNGTRHDARQIWQFWLLVIDENYDKKGKLDGAYTLWRDKKIPRVQGTYDHGKKTGTWAWFDRNNNKEREGDFADGKKTGAWFEWTENKLAFSGSFTDGKPDGDFIYYDKAGTELGRFDIHDGTGTMETYYPNKKVSSKTHMVAGAMDGVYQELTQRGKVVVEGRYSSDHKNGWWREWNDLGPGGLQLQLEQHWKWGKLDGAVKKYENGKLASEQTYKSGKVEGAYTEYRNGKPSFTGTFANDRRTGTWTTYDPDGAVMLTATYKDGVLEGPWRQLTAGVVVEGAMVAGRRSGTWTRTDKTGAKQVLTYKPV